MHVAHDTHARLPVSEQTGAESKIGKAEAQSFLSEANQRSNKVEIRKPFKVQPYKQHEPEVTSESLILEILKC